MRSFAWFLGLILLALAVMATLTYPAWQLLHPLFGFPFHRVADRLGMITLAAGFFLVARRLRLADRESLGFATPPRQFLREASFAFALGVLLMGVIIVIMLALHLRLLRPGLDLSMASFGKLAAQGLMRGIAVALIEETFLRGAMWTGIARESGALAATVLTSLVYALTHFVSSYHVPANQIGWHSGLDMLAGSFGAFARPLDVADAYICLFAVGVVLATVRMRTGNIAADQAGWHSGIDMLAGSFGAFARPLQVADAYICLFAVGVVLATVRMRTGNIAASLGLHAGFVWVITFVRETSVADTASSLHGLLSSFDGVVGWLVCAWTVLVGFALNQFYRRRVNGPQAA